MVSECRALLQIAEKHKLAISRTAAEARQSLDITAAVRGSLESLFQVFKYKYLQYSNIKSVPTEVNSWYQRW